VLHYCRTYGSLQTSTCSDKEYFPEGAKPCGRKAFIRGFVKEVRVTGNEVVLNYSMPVLPDNVI